MKLAHLTYLLDAGGGGIPPVVEALVDEQARAGEAVRGFGLHPSRYQVLPRAAGAELYAFPPDGPLALGYSRALQRALDAFDPELVHLHGLFTGASLISERWAARTKRPLVVSPHGMLEPWALAHSAWKKRLFRAAIEDRNLCAAGCLHALCAPEAEHIRALGLRRPIAVVPNGVDLGELDAPAPKLDEVIPEARGRPVLLFLSRIHPKKGLPLLAEAWSRVERRDWLLAIAGPDQLGHQAEIQAQVQRLGLAKDVVFTGPLHGERKRAALRGCAGFALPSHSEGFSMAVLEALAARKPVLITHPCNFDEAGRAGAGWVGEPTADSVTAMVDALLATPESEREAMGERGRALVESKYTWPKVGAQFLAVYRWLLGSAPRPDCVEG